MSLGELASAWDDGGVHVLFASAEFAPVATVGGLAAASAGLVRELRRQGVDVDVVLPDYGAVELAGQQVTELVTPEWVGATVVRSGTHATAGPLHLISAPGLARSHPYQRPNGAAWEDNDARFLAFSAAVASLCQVVEPDVLHLNDWHTAAALADVVPEMPTVLSIHNLAYQGITHGGWLDRLGPRSGAFEWYGQTNPFSGGLALADAIVAVSPNYAREIQTSEHGHGLDRSLASRGDALVGILNGIDDEVWNPVTDPHLTEPFGVQNLEAKAATRAAVLKRVGLQSGSGPLLVMVTRLVEQKGVDLVVPLARYIDALDMKLVVLGSGEPHYVEQLEELATSFPHTVQFVSAYDEALSHQLFGGGDVLLMPSRFEPCGLAQLQALRYGTLPIVTAVGGLVDTVIDLDVAPTTGTGWLAPEPNSLAVLDALHRARRLWDTPALVRAARLRAMAIDSSWRVPAAEHRALYAHVAGSH